MARLKDLTKEICSLENADYTLYTKGDLEDYVTRLEGVVESIKEAVNQWDYQQELKELKKKYGIK